MKNKIKTWWSQEEINKLELSFLHNIFECNSQENVDAAYMYAKFMSKVKLDPDNYPVFLKLFAIGNQWITDALIGQNDPLTYFKEVQPNSFIIKFCIEMLTNFKPGEIYPKLILVILGIIKAAYENPLEGYKLYPLNTDQLNQIGKQLIKEKGQQDQNNKIILHILDRLASINDPVPPNNKEMEDLANHSNKIRGKFLDINKNLSEAIPEILLEKGDYKKRNIMPSFIK